MRKSSDGRLFDSNFLLADLSMQKLILRLRFLITAPKPFDNLLQIILLFHKFFSLDLVDAVDPLIFNNYRHCDLSLLRLIGNNKSPFADLLKQAIR